MKVLFAAEFHVVCKCWVIIPVFSVDVCSGIHFKLVAPNDVISTSWLSTKLHSSKPTNQTRNSAIVCYTFLFISPTVSFYIYFFLLICKFFARFLFSWKADRLPFLLIIGGWRQMPSFGRRNNSGVSDTKGNWRMRRPNNRKCLYRIGQRWHNCMYRAAWFIIPSLDVGVASYGMTHKQYSLNRAANW